MRQRAEPGYGSHLALDGPGLGQQRRQRLQGCQGTEPYLGCLASHRQAAFTKPKSSNEVEKKSEASESSAPKARSKAWRAKSLKPRALKEVRIDATTTVPTDLYWNMLRAGEKAKRLDRSSFLFNF